MNKTITIDQVNGNISVSVKVVSPFTQEVTITNNDEGTTWSKAVSAYHGECFVTAAKELAECPCAQRRATGPTLSVK